MTDKEIKSFYNSSAWKCKRLEILSRDRHECVDCRKRLDDAAKKGIILSGRDRYINRATEVHHIKELREHFKLKLDNDNLVSLCSSCHNKRHGREPIRMFKKKKRITEEMW